MAEKKFRVIVMLENSELVNDMVDYPTATQISNLVNPPNQYTKEELRALYLLCFNINSNKTMVLHSQYGRGLVSEAQYGDDLTVMSMNKS